MRTTPIIIAAVALLILAAAPASASYHNETELAVSTGASGQCYSEDGQDGGDTRAGAGATVTISFIRILVVNAPYGADVTYHPVILPDAEGAAAAAAQFGQGTAEDPEGDACDNPDGHDHDGDGNADHDHRDYVEAHAAGLQVCYDQYGVRLDGQCPTKPAGPSTT